MQLSDATLVFCGRGRWCGFWKWYFVFWTFGLLDAAKMIPGCSVAVVEAGGVGSTKFPAQCGIKWWSVKSKGEKILINIINETKIYQNLPKSIKRRLQFAKNQEPECLPAKLFLSGVTQKHLGEISNTRYRNSNFANIVVLHFLKINVVNWIISEIWVNQVYRKGQISWKVVIASRQIQRKLIPFPWRYPTITIGTGQ